ncbi:MAG TPA: hypothetical protein VFS43_18670 [Polyangiaceae bacterium]|nr:hypothetical protein [Polyangiaceae bacterium]
MTTKPGETSAELRRRVVERAASGPGVTIGPAMAELEAFVDAVALDPRAADAAGLLERGHSEDVVFEVAVAAAVGAGLARVEGALEALRGLKQ